MSQSSRTTSQTSPAFACGHYWKRGNKQGVCRDCLGKAWREAHPNAECAKCGKPVYRSNWHLRRNPDGIVFCGYTHRNQYYAANRRLPVKCDGCGKNYWVPKYNAEAFRTHYCSTTCRMRPNTKCANCSLPLRRQPSHIGKAAYCNKECRKKAFEKTPNAQCTMCSKPIYREPFKLAEGHRPVCSPECRSVMYKADAVKNSPKPNVKCSTCNTPLYREPKWLRSNKNFYCDMACMGVGTKRRMTGTKRPGLQKQSALASKPCSWCNEQVYRKPWMLNRRERIYCTRKCQADHRRALTKGLPRPGYDHTPNSYCGNCGKHFWRAPSKLHRGPLPVIPFCDNNCYLEARRVGKFAIGKHRLPTAA